MKLYYEKKGRAKWAFPLGVSGSPVPLPSDALPHRCLVGTAVFGSSLRLGVARPVAGSDPFAFGESVIVSRFAHNHQAIASCYELTLSTCALDVELR